MPTIIFKDEPRKKGQRRHTAAEYLADVTREAGHARLPDGWNKPLPFVRSGYLNDKRRFLIVVSASWDVDVLHEYAREQWWDLLERHDALKAEDAKRRADNVRRKALRTNSKRGVEQNQENAKQREKLLDNLIDARRATFPSESGYACAKKLARQKVQDPVSDTVRSFSFNTIYNRMTERGLREPSKKAT